MPNNRPKMPQDAPQDRDTDHRDAREAPEPTCGACGDPIRGAVFYTRWGAVHRACKEIPNGRSTS
jgi:hypothetical protein